MKFKPYFGDTGRLPTDSNHLNFVWLENRNLLASASRQGNAMSCHFTCDKEGMKKIKKAINEFCELMFWMFPWCRMILAKIKDKKIVNIVEDCGFEKILEVDNKYIYMRVKNGRCR